MKEDQVSPVNPARSSVRSRRFTVGELPTVLINMAITADGKIATANRAVGSFGSPADQEHLLALRATADAVMCGARTVDAGAPVTMGPGPAPFREARRQAGLAEFNLRVLVSGSGTLRTNAEIFKHRFSPILVLTTERISRLRRRELEKVVDVVKVCGCNEIDFAMALRWLRREWHVKRLVCEGGGELNVALMRAGLVDELHLTLCPLVFGGQGAPTLADGLDALRLAEAVPFQMHAVRQVGEELFLEYRRPADPPGRRVVASRRRSVPGVRRRTSNATTAPARSKG